MERSIPQPAAPEAAPDSTPRDGEETPEAPFRLHDLGAATRWTGLMWGIGLMVVVLAVYFVTQQGRTSPYLHFPLQAQAWLEGKTSIPTPGYQDVMPILDSNGQPTGRGILPFPPLPAVVLMPFVSIWGLAVSEQMLSVIFGAIDVGVAYWMLGFLPVKQEIRRLTSLFLGLGTVLWYASVIGSTWFWAHVVAVGCLLLSVGLALSADRDAAQPVPARRAVDAVRAFTWPGGWPSVILLCGLGVVAEMLFVLAGAGTSAAAMAGVGVLLGVVAVMLAVSVAGRPGVLAPFVLAVAVVGGIPAVLLAANQSQLFIQVFDAVLIVLVAALLWFGGRRGGTVDRALASIWTALSTPEALQVAAGIAFGLAVTARLTILFGFPFLILVGGGGTWLRRAMLAGAGVAIPLTALLVITFATSGHLFNPAYDYLYHLEVDSYGSVFPYHATWSITDIRYVPQNIAIMLFGAPRIEPAASGVFPGFYDTPLCIGGQARGLFDKSCPLALPESTGMSVLLTSPAFFMGLVAWRPIRHLQLDRATAGATIAVVAIAFVNLMHFSQGWVQFGYRFSNDFVPFALILVALGASRIRRLWPLAVLVGLSIAINFWGTTWGVILGW